jgi:hypothetical protein
MKVGIEIKEISQNGELRGVTLEAMYLKIVTHNNELICVIPPAREGEVAAYFISREDLIRAAKAFE